MILERSEHKTLSQFSKETEADHLKPSSAGSVPEDNPPAYSQAPQTTSSGSSPSRVVSLSRSRQGVVPYNAPVNGLQMYTRRDSIRGTWSLDPQAPQVPAQNLVQMFLDGRAGRKRICGYRCSKKKLPPTAVLNSRHGNVHASLRVVGESALRAVATIHSKTRGGNIFIDLASISPMRTVHIDANSRRGNVTLLVPRSFNGLVQLSCRHGLVEMLPALAASGIVIKGRKKETTILLGDGPMPAVGSDIITDTARIYSRHGRVRVGFSGEDYVIEPPTLMDQAIKLMQKLILPSSQKC